MNDERGTCLTYITQTWTGDYDAANTVAGNGIDSLALLDWLFYVEDVCGVSIPPEFFERVDVLSHTIPGLYDKIVSMYRQADSAGQAEDALG